MTLKTTLLFAIALVWALGLAVAQDTSDAHVRVFHLSTDAPEVDVLVNGNVALTSVPFRGFTDFLALPPGTYTFSVNLAGTATQVLQEVLTLEAGRFYSVLAIGRVGNGSLRLLATGENRLTPEPGSAKVRVIHAASTAPAVDIYFTSPYINLDGQNPVLRGVPFSGFSEHLTVPAGLYQGRVAVGGTKTVAIDSGAVRLLSGQVRTLVALDPATEGGPFQIVVLVDKN